MKPLDILNDLVKNKKVDLEKADYWREENKQTIYSRENVISSKDDVKAHAEKLKTMFQGFIPEALYNKKFSIGDFEVIIQHATAFTADEQSHKKPFGSYGYKPAYFTNVHQWNVILKYHGVYLHVYEYEAITTLDTSECLPTQTNYFNIVPTEDKPFIIKETTIKKDYEGYSRIKEFFAILDVNSLVLEEQTLNLIEASYYIDLKLRDKNKTVHDYTADEIDLNWLVSSEVKKGVYTPEAATIKWLLFQWRKNEWNSKKLNHGKNTLHDLGIKTVQLRADAHFDLRELFDIKGVTIKAPQKIIEAYKYGKYADSKVVEKIKADKEQAKKDEALLKYNRQFSLVQHGKTILENVDLSEIHQYLENYKVSKTNFEDVIFSKIKPVFDANPEIALINLAAWGTYYKYECAGESYYRDDIQELNEHIDKDVLDDIVTIYGNDFGTDEDSIEIKYGKSERGGAILGVVKDAKGKLKLQTENYDPE